MACLKVSEVLKRKMAELTITDARLKPIASKVLAGERVGTIVQ